MANTIKIKRGLSSNLDNLTLQEGELATTTDTRKLYIGNADGTKTELGQQGPQGVRGTKWWVGDFYSQMFDDANNGDLLLNTSEMSPGEVLQFYDGMWDSVANIRGPQGPQGEKGEPGESIPVGSIIPYGDSVVPETYLPCNGQAVSRTDYPELFAIIGTSFGSGDGSTTFNVPDYRDKFVLGAGGDVDLAETGGEKEVTLTVEQIPPHNHSLTAHGSDGTGNMVSQSIGNGGSRVVASWVIGNTGGGQPHNNMPPYVGTYYIIKAKQSASVVATVVDNLESTSATDALSANMGKKLNDKINETNNKSAITVKCNSNINYNGQNADVTVNFTDVSLQKGSNLSYSNGIFTAQKAKTIAVSYYFNNASNSGEMVPIIRIWKNDTQVHQAGITLRATYGNDPLTIANFLIDLEEGDTVKITYNRNSGNGTLRSGSYITLMEI